MPLCRHRRDGGRIARVPPRTRPPSDDRALRRIRGLLAKAESTEFPDEAESLTAKAQELMTRHAVDAALLEVGPSPTDGRAVGTRRVHVQDPYVRAKMQLLAAVAEANDVRVVWYSNLGIANLVGGRADLAAVELLFTSLLLQVARALSAAERPVGAPVGVPVVPPVLPARLRAPDRRAAADRPAERHGRGSGRARRRPAPGPAQPPGGGRGAGRRALPARARHPQPGVGRRGRLVRRTRGGRARRRRPSPVLTALTLRALPRSHPCRITAPPPPIGGRHADVPRKRDASLTSGFCQWPWLASEHGFDD